LLPYLFAFYEKRGAATRLAPLQGLFIDLLPLGVQVEAGRGCVGISVRIGSFRGCLGDVGIVVVRVGRLRMYGWEGVDLESPQGFP